MPRLVQYCTRRSSTPGRERGRAAMALHHQRWPGTGRCREIGVGRRVVEGMRILPSLGGERDVFRFERNRVSSSGCSVAERRRISGLAGRKVETNDRGDLGRGRGAEHRFAGPRTHATIVGVGKVDRHEPERREVKLRQAADTVLPIAADDPIRAGEGVAGHARTSTAPARNRPRAGKARERCRRPARYRFHQPLRSEMKYSTPSGDHSG